ncbi:MAG TPA: beta-ketoacyl-ACP synthase III [Bacillota bacterium]|nr:beta-ketoacyl-ACP synthase III [Bacillota bacterium]
MATNLIPAGVTGIGIGIPDKILCNAELEKMVDTSDEWITSRSGIKERHIAEQGTNTSDLAVKAAREALADAGLQPAELDLIIVATATPDYLFPATACVVQDKLGAVNAVAFDLGAGCTGQIYALTVATQFINTGMYRNVMVIGAEVMSRVMNWEDRTTCVLFGDGASALVLQPVSSGKGVLACGLGTDGSGVSLLYQPAGGSAMPASAETVEKNLHSLQMVGKEVFKFAVRTIVEVSETVLAKAGLNMDDVDWFIPHQANTRIIDAAAKRLELPMEKVVINVDRYGNTSAASIGIALAEIIREGKVKDGDILLLVGFGAGLTYGGILLRWGK